MDEKKRVLLMGAVFFVLVTVAVSVYYFLYVKTREESPAQDISKGKLTQVSEDKLLPEEEPLNPSQVELDKSDNFIRKLIEGVSSHQRFSSWLRTEDLIRKLAAAVDNIANGMSPRPQIDFFSLEEGFKIKKENGVYSLDPEGYSRYDQVADVFLTLDSEKCARLYRQLKLLLQEAYRDLGYPQENFHETLTKAIVELLEVPVVEGNILLEKKVFTYRMVDRELENMSEAQKHLFRMGPENIRIIQDKLRELAAELRIPKSRLPR